MLSNKPSPYLNDVETAESSTPQMRNTDESYDVVVPEAENLYTRAVKLDVMKEMKTEIALYKNSDIKSGNTNININKYTPKSRSTQHLPTTPDENSINKRLQPGKCPTGKHSNLGEKESCLCIILNKLFLYQNEEMISEWHWSFSDKVKLTDMQLKRPTKCVQGGQGMVFWVNEKNTGREYALKMKLREMRSKVAWMIERREANILKQVEHDFIVNLFHVYETPSAMFMVMEYLDGGCLWSHIAHIGLLPEDYSAYYTACILEALLYLHKLNIVYRDMKAENIVLDWQGRPRLIDFGMAKKINRTKLEEADEPYPSTNYYFAAYLAPEIYMTPGVSNTMVDSWGLGYIVAEIVLGYGVYVAMPWEKQNGKHIKPGWTLALPDDAKVSSNCSDFLQKMLVQTPNLRLSLTDAMSHSFFGDIKWSQLAYVASPNLSELKRRSGHSFHATHTMKHTSTVPGIQNKVKIHHRGGIPSVQLHHLKSSPSPMIKEPNVPNNFPSVRDSLTTDKLQNNSCNYSKLSVHGSNLYNRRGIHNSLNPQMRLKLNQTIFQNKNQERKPKIYETMGNLRNMR